MELCLNNRIHLFSLNDITKEFWGKTVFIESLHIARKVLEFFGKKQHVLIKRLLQKSYVNECEQKLSNCSNYSKLLSHK